MQVVGSNAMGHEVDESALRQSDVMNQLNAHQYARPPAGYLSRYNETRGQSLRCEAVRCDEPADRSSICQGVCRIFARMQRDTRSMTPFVRVGDLRM